MTPDGYHRVKKKKKVIKNQNTCTLVRRKNSAFDVPFRYNKKILHYC